MPTVKPDIREVPPEAEIGVNGTSARRTFLVMGLTGTVSQRVLEALQVEGIPRRGDAHPGDQFLPVLRVHAAILEEHAELAQVTVSYGIPEAADATEPSIEPVQVVRLGASVQTVQTMFDANGDLIVIDYASEAAQATILQPVTVEYQQPVRTRHYRRREHPTEEVAGVSMTADAKSEFYAGRVNSVAIWGKAAGMWLCTSIEVDSDDGGASVVLDYNFQGAPPGRDWDAVAIYQNADGTTPSDIRFGGNGVEQNGVWKGRVQPQANFAHLSL